MIGSTGVGAHPRTAPVYVFLQVSGRQSDDKTLMQVKQSFACCSARIGSWRGS
jgi:hypothetical protein